MLCQRRPEVPLTGLPRASAQPRETPPYRPGSTPARTDRAATPQPRLRDIDHTTACPDDTSIQQLTRLLQAQTPRNHAPKHLSSP